MAPQIRCESTRVAALGAPRGEDGFLIFADDQLAAVVSHLQASVEDDGLRGHWFLEAGFGRCAKAHAPVWRSPSEAQEWVLSCYESLEPVS